jgi:hypothetical protein
MLDPAELATIGARLRALVHVDGAEDADEVARGLEGEEARHGSVRMHDGVAGAMSAEKR